MKIASFTIRKDASKSRSRMMIKIHSLPAIRFNGVELIFGDRETRIYDSNLDDEKTGIYNTFCYFPGNCEGFSLRESRLPILTQKAFKNRIKSALRHIHMAKRKGIIIGEAINKIR